MAHYLLGRAYYDHGEVPMALECYQKAAECADTLSQINQTNIDYAKVERMFNAAYTGLCVKLVALKQEIAKRVHKILYGKFVFNDSFFQTFVGFFKPFALSCLKCSHSGKHLFV